MSSRSRRQREQSRREFLYRSSLVAAAGMATGPLSLAAHGARTKVSANDTLNVGLIGCGGRGSGAVNDTLSANYGLQVVAMADLKEDVCRRALKNLERHSDNLKVKDDAIYAGLDAYKRVCSHPDVDIVILTTSPGFRPAHLTEAVEAGKHVFAEKPLCVDPAGYRAACAAHDLAERQGTAIVTGTQYRRQPSYVEAVEKIHGGMIGKVLSGQSYYCVQGIWYRPRKEGMTDLEYQLYNWYHFVWLSGDQIVEQAVHNLDAVNWVMKGAPQSAFGSGGCLTRPADSEIYDNMNLDYAYANGASISFKCRQQPGSTARVINTFHGTDGVAYINPGGSLIVSHDDEELFVYEGRGNNPYQQEHVDLVNSIRDGSPIVEARETADSSLTAVMGRMAAYTGQEVSWEFAKASALDLMPDEVTPDTPAPVPTVRAPGRTTLI